MLFQREWNRKEKVTRWMRKERDIEKRSGKRKEVRRKKKGK